MLEKKGISKTVTGKIKGSFEVKKEGDSIQIVGYKTNTLREDKEEVDKDDRHTRDKS